MPEINVSARGKRLYVEVEREDKYGKRKPSKVRQDSMPVAGMYSAKELERMIPDYAQLHGVPESAVKVEAYEHKDAPLETNPRHRGEGTRWDRPKKTQEVVTNRPIRVRKVFTGGIPQTEEEWAQHVAEFYARRDAQT